MMFSADDAVWQATPNHQACAAKPPPAPRQTHGEYIRLRVEAVGRALRLSTSGIPHTS